MSKRSVLITGCSRGGLGDALAQESHRHGLRVIATARNLSKVAHLSDLGIEVVQLDVLSDSSIASAVTRVEQLLDNAGLDILLNNAGGNYAMPVVDGNISEAKALFDLNFWSYITVTQAFIPLLRATAAGTALIVNQTSIAAAMSTPWWGYYNASKAAAALMTDTLRLEMQPFNIRVCELRTGNVKSGFFNNQNAGNKPKLPEHSIYSPASDHVEQYLTGDYLKADGMASEPWARAVVAQITASNPPYRIWEGTHWWVGRIVCQYFPTWLVNMVFSQKSGVNKVVQIIRAEGKTK
ncbi:putative estradiol 17 beta-dehydrogenase [Myriangium duriaei CBS 260.36]|uniref:Estradiol 17 beta-dehydrogenase n=1 Tax=Myriangium duriaei CBS 260.36 TaxID=1168546 RepID=A0A9P4MJF9_9PEZI|nr:putative estradiol 17 beta-dehydrogenase [Myriangium duriaei CBS 260.36]